MHKTAPAALDEDDVLCKHADAAAVHGDPYAVRSKHARPLVNPRAVPGAGDVSVKADQEAARGNAKP